MAFAERLRIERGARLPFPDDYAAPEARRGTPGPAADVYSHGRMLVRRTRWAALVAHFGEPM
jgi:hypothetical protein